MSWVAEKNAMQAKTLRVDAKKNDAGRHTATASMHAVISICIARVHLRLVENISTNGLQKGLIIHGRESRPVHAVISGMEIPSSQ